MAVVEKKNMLLFSFDLFYTFLCLIQILAVARKMYTLPLAEAQGKA